MMNIKKIILSIIPLIIFYLLKIFFQKRKNQKTPFMIDKEKIEEGEIIDKEK